MDPLSISASITALLQVTGTIISYLRDVQGAPNDRTNFIIEISGLNGILPILQQRVEQAKLGDPWFTAVLKLGVTNGPLDQLKSHLDRLAVKLKPVEGFKDVGKRLTWAFDKTEVVDTLSKIERTKTLVALALTDDLL